MNYESWTTGLHSAALPQSVGHTLQLCSALFNLSPGGHSSLLLDWQV